MSLLTRVNLRLTSRLVPNLRHGKQNYSVATQEEEYSEKPEYPPILDLSYRGKKLRAKESWHDEIKNIKTVEEKLIKINMPRYYGWHSLLLSEHQIPYNAQSLAQFITRTHLIKDVGLPKYYDRVISSEKLDAIVKSVKSQIEDIILFEHTSRRRQQELESHVVNDPVTMDNIISEAVVQQINRILLANLSTECDHLSETEIDFEPRVESFWFVGGIEPTKYVRKAKMGMKWSKEYANDPVDRCVRYQGDPILQLRHQLPLKEIITLSESENSAFDIPEFRYDPRVLGYNMDHTHARTIPGFWPGDPSEFGLLSYHKSGHLKRRPVAYNDNEDTLNVQAIYASYAWLLSQACYQGFSTVTELTYPLLTQTVITNGQDWSLYAYQLNTTLHHSAHADENPRKNICWSTGTLKLFEQIEDGKLVGFNEDVVKELIKFYVNAPQRREGVTMKPYLGTSEQKIADISDPDKRAWLERTFKHMYSFRPRHKLMETADDWEKIYKIDHPSKFMDKKRKKYEFGINVMNRRYDEHLPKYVPKAIRPAGPKQVMRWEKTYYP